MKKYLNQLLLLFMLPAPAIADEFASAEQLKSLFTAPSERQQLDTLRTSGAFKKGRLPKPQDKPVFKEPLKVEMRGVLIRNGDRPVVWINKGNTMKSMKIDEAIRVRAEQTDRASKKVPVRIYNKTYRMKPGEIWSEINDKVIDSYRIK